MSASLVVLVVHPGSELYGSDRMMCESVDAFIQAGFTVHVALPSNGPLVHEVMRRGAACRILTMPVLRKSALGARGFAALALTAVRSLPPTLALLRELRPDVVYVSTQILPSWLLSGRLSGAVTVCHVHEAERHPSKVVETGLVAPLLLAHSVLANSQYSADVLTQVSPGLKQRTMVLYNGVVGPSDPAPPRSALTGPVRLLYVGRLSPRKGPDVALAATQRLRERGVDATLDLLGAVFTGYEWFEESLRRQYADLLEQGVVRFLGFHPFVWPILADHDILVVPSTAPEPFGNTAVEGTLARRPVVVSRTGGLPEAVAGIDSAVVVEPADPEALAAGIHAVIQGWPQFASATKTAAETARNRFSPHRFRKEVAGAVWPTIRARRCGLREAQPTQ